jgi:hypothetical protein
MAECADTTALLPDIGEAPARWVALVSAEGVSLRTIRPEARSGLATRYRLRYQKAGSE